MKLQRLLPIFLLVPALGLAQTPAPGSPDLGAQDQIVNRIVAQEKVFERSVTPFQPRIETYIQSLRPDNDKGTVPASDAYFLGRLSLVRGFNEPMFSDHNSGNIAHKFFPIGFAAMIMPDRTRFDQQHYMFSYQGRQFLGSVRCVVFNVVPRTPIAKGSFVGRIWAEDQGYTIVRFDGTYEPNPRSHYVHFDSWRENLGPNLWLPVAIYSQETDQRTGFFGHIDFKAQTRFWGYQLSGGPRQTSLTDIQVDPDNGGGVNDESQTSHDRTPLEVTNNLTIDPEVRCRVMLTSPLESFTVGHTIVLSRGLIDVLPDEPSLAMVLAHELGHIVLDHGINTDYAFDDRMMFPDEQSFKRIRVAHTPEEEAAADQKGLELLKKSPYKDKLASAGLFLEAMQHEAPGVPNLISPHWGNQMVIKGRVDRMQALLASAPQLQVRDLKQIPALPLGARIQLDPWSDKLSLLQAQAVAILSPRDKLSFEITPLMPYLTREGDTASAANGKPGNPPNKNNF